MQYTNDFQEFIAGYSDGERLSEVHFFLANRKNVLYTTSQKITKRQNSIVLTIHVDKNYIR